MTLLVIHFFKDFILNVCFYDANKKKRNVMRIHVEIQFVTLKDTKNAFEGTKKVRRVATKIRQNCCLCRIKKYQTIFSKIKKVKN